MFSRARQAEILRSSQKDDYYGGSIRSALGEIVQGVCGPRYWLRWSREYDLLADVAYFALTTLGGYQTLGEEYVNIVLVNKTLRALPTRLTRACMILLQCCVPYALDRVLLYTEKCLENNTFQGLSAEGREELKKLIPVLRHVILILHRCNLAVFYIKGVFYHIAKRFTDVHYILVRPDFNPDRVSNYRILGLLCVLQLVWTFAQQIVVLMRKFKYQSRQELSRLPAERSRQAESTLQYAPTLTSLTKCALCLEARTFSTATPCGHLFCWGCIHEWCKTKPICPICREEFQISRLIYLKNYDTFM